MEINLQLLTGKCSHCGKSGKHHLEFRNRGLHRNIYRCGECSELTVRCRICNDFAKHRKGWSDELCADHWSEDELWAEGTLDCISKWPELWAHQPKLWKRALWSISPYRGDSIESFAISPLEVRGGREIRVVYINGVLGQSDQLFEDWSAVGSRLFPGLSSYGTRWESRRASTNEEVAKLLTGEALAAYQTWGASVVWSWHSTAMKAADTGRMLAQIIARTEGQRFVLCGHSLGARVAFYALLELARIGRRDLVKTAHLLGGAVGVGDLDDWTAALSACSGGISNYYSKNDDVLKYLYIPAMGFSSDPIGRNPLPVKGVRNYDVSDLVSGHTGYKSKFADIAGYPLGL